LSEQDIQALVRMLQQSSPLGQQHGGTNGVRASAAARLADYPA
jgi:hypothetical protein